MSLALLAATLGVCGQAKPYAKVTAPAINEMSGIVKSRHHSDTFWVHNDSGDSARIFAIRRDGSLIGEVKVDGAQNVDWEDIAVDNRNLYVSDLGNNGNARKDLSIYVLPEPTPASSRAKAVRLRVAYEDQKEFPPAFRHFDCEALFALRGRLYAITKHRSGPFMPDVGANLYRLDTRYTDRVNKLVRVDSAADLGGWVTAADVSPDGKTLAVLVQAPSQSVWLLSTAARGDRFLTAGNGRQIKLDGLQQAEAVCWEDGKTLIIGNEQRELFRLRVTPG